MNVFLDLNERQKRGVGCMLGQLCGDSLGGLVEFMSPDEILEKHPGGVRHLVDGGVWSTVAGQPTDDSEMALALARSLASRGTYERSDVREAYVSWMNSDPFDSGETTRAGLEGSPRMESQANGALMRASPLAIFGAGRDPHELAGWAEQDAELTHPHHVCREVNVLYVRGIAHAIEHGCDGPGLYECIHRTAVDIDASRDVMDVIARARLAPPDDYITHMGWVLVAFQNALWQILNASDFESGVVGSIMPGGDTDTNAAIAGSMLGAVHGFDSIPGDWIRAVRSCRPDASNPAVRRPRPQCYWPSDAVELSLQLLG